VKLSRPLLLTVSLITFSLLIPLRASAQTPPPPTLISRSSTGEPGNGNSSSPSLSADGRWIAYASAATNLVPNDTNGVTDIFVHDRQTGQTTRVSVSTNGEQGHGRSTFPALSGNGRYVAYPSEAANLVPADTNGLPDIFVHDRLTGETKRASVGLNGEQANGASSNVSISHDGRYLAYQTLASNLVRGDDNGAWDVYIYDNGVTGNVVRASVSSEGVGGNLESVNPQISGDGRMVVFVSASNTLLSNDDAKSQDVFAYNRVLAQTTRVSQNVNGTRLPEGFPFSPIISNTGRHIHFFYSISPTHIHLYHQDTLNNQLRDLLDLGEIPVAYLMASEDGQFIFYQKSGDNENPQLIRLNRENLQEEVLASSLALGQFDSSANGQMVTWIEGNDLYLVEFTDARQSHFLSGRVTAPGVGDNPGHPLALVTLTDSLGNATRTDINGYFWSAGYQPAPLTLTLEKKGYTLTPSTCTLQLSTDSPSLTFTATPTAPLAEARLDLGMPYHFSRGCPDPYLGCGGKYHGFTSGYCTDLILDAYTYGADFDIQFDLEQNTRAHPEHFYRWHDARDAHDMWRFFSYTGQMLPNTLPYAPGDIVFFDWTEDGEIDHVALVSEVDANARPIKLLDATGKTDFNPSGLAAELPWQAFYDRTARGHARWSGAYQPIIPFPAQTQMLQIAASGANINLRLTDPAGGALSLTENTLPAGWYTNLIWEESASVEIPDGDVATSSAYTAEISNPTGESAPFRLAIQLVVHGIVIGRVETSGNLPAGATRSIPIFVEVDEDRGYQLTAFPSRIPKIRGPLKGR
jgi:Tol biopolymer transport system component